MRGGDLPRPYKNRLADLHGRARVLELGGGGVRVLTGHALTDGLGSAVDQVLGLLGAKTGDLTDGFDGVDLGVSSRGEDDRELGLLLGNGLGGSAATGRGGAAAEAVPE